MAPLALSVIRTDGGTQTRATINADTVADYAEAMRGGAEFPAVTVFYDGSAYWLADGFHRWQAATKAGRGEIEADIRQGTRRDAVLFSVGANADHGLRRTNEDKRRAVMTLLNDEEWCGWSDREIARRCSVSNDFVSRMRPASLSSDDSERPAERTYTTKHGTVATMQVGDIGRTREPREEAPTLAQRPAVEPPVRSQIASTIPADAAADHYAVFVLNGLDRILAAAEHWPDPAEALGHLRQFPNFSRKLPVVGSWLARLLELSGTMPDEPGMPGAPSLD